MKILQFNYELPDYKLADINSFQTEPVELLNSNLLVGKNASGKSTIVNALITLVEMLKGGGIRIGKFKIILQGKNQHIYKYECEIGVSKNRVIEITEELSENDKILLTRTHDKAAIFSISLKGMATLNPPRNKLICQVRRDEKDHPFLEQVIKWAESVHSFKFGHVHSSSFMMSATTSDFVFDEGLTSIKDKDLNKILGELKDESRTKIINEFNCIGYEVTLLNIKRVGESNIIYVKENGIKYEIPQQSLSQGMFRSLFLLIFIHHLIDKENAKMIIIDDLCEGLDYDRATKLGKLIFKSMEDNNIQFLATSNDYFLMNVIDVKYWNLIYREGPIIKIKNHTNSKEKFDKFRISGLNNFDLFSSNFLDS